MHDLFLFLAVLCTASAATLFIRATLSIILDDFNSSHLVQLITAVLLVFIAALLLDDLSMSSADASARRVTCDATNGAEGEAHTWHCTLIHP